jgi:hypothetical protein
MKPDNDPEIKVFRGKYPNAAAMSVQILFANRHGVSK